MTYFYKILNTTCLVIHVAGSNIVCKGDFFTQRFKELTVDSIAYQKTQEVEELFSYFPQETGLSSTDTRKISTTLS